MRIEAERKEQQFDNNLTSTAGLLGGFLGYVAIKDCFNNQPRDVIGGVVLLTTSALLMLYTGLKVSIAWQSRNSNQN